MKGDGDLSELEERPEKQPQVWINYQFLFQGKILVLDYWSLGFINKTIGIKTIVLK